MDDLIDREELLKQIDFLEPVADGYRFTKQQLITAMNGMKQCVITKIKVIPSADTERHAHWIDHGKHGYTCSHCHRHPIKDVRTSFCARCGCKMDGVKRG